MNRPLNHSSTPAGETEWEPVHDVPVDFGTPVILYDECGGPYGSCSHGPCQYVVSGGKPDAAYNMQLMIWTHCNSSGPFWEMAWEPDDDERSGIGPLAMSVNEHGCRHESRPREHGQGMAF